MPSGKRSKEATWKEEELLSALKTADEKNSKSKHEREQGKHSEKDRSKHRSHGEDKDTTLKPRSSKSDDAGSKRHHKAGKSTEKVGKESRSGESSREGREKRKDRDGSSRRDKDRSSSKKDERLHENREDRESKSKSRDREREKTKEGRHVESLSNSDKRSDSTEKRHRSEKDRERHRDKEKEGQKERHRSKHDEKNEGSDLERSGRRERRGSKDDNRREREHVKERRDDRERSRRDKSDRHRDSDDARASKDSRRAKDKERERRHRERKDEHDINGETVRRRSREEEHIKVQYNDNDSDRSAKSKNERKESSKNTDDPNDRHRKHKRKSKSGKDKAQISVEDTMDFTPDGRDTVVNEDIEHVPEKDEVISDDVDDDVNEDFGNYDNYDDDFEDYDDDFDEEINDDESTNISDHSEKLSGNNDHPDSKPRVILTESEQLGMEQVRQAICAENERASSASRSPSRPSTMEAERGSLEESPPSTSKTLTPSPLKGRINFIAAKQKQVSNVTARKTKQRGKELLKLLDLDIVSVHLFELVPTNEYELYMKSFGKTDSSQVSVQTSDETFDIEVQTDEIEEETKWCQHSNEIQASGAGDEVEKKFYQIDGSESGIALTSNTVRLNNFLMKASRVCLSLLEEASSDLLNQKQAFQEVKTNLSDGFVGLEANHPLIQGRDVKSFAVSPEQSNLFLTGHGMSHYTKENEDLAAMGLICVWNKKEPNGPQRFLISEGVPTCVCFSPSKASFVFAGMDDGSVVVWDLTESSIGHLKRMSRGVECSLYSSTFTTASGEIEKNHHCPVVGLSLLSQDRQASNGEISDGILPNVFKDGVGLSFQIATMDERGLINIWIIVEVERPDPGGSEVDLGLSPGGKVKLMGTGYMMIDMSRRDPLDTFCKSARPTVFQVHPRDPSHLYIGTDEGSVIHKARFGEKASPRAYKSNVACPQTVTSLDISPWEIDYFLVGTDSGTVGLYSFRNEMPILEWKMFTNGAPCTVVQWSRSRPCVFYTLDANYTFSAWDLLERDDKPIWQEVYNNGSKSLIHFILPGGAFNLDDSAGEHKAEIVLFYESGSIEVHRLSRRLCQQSPDELDRFLSYIGESL